MRNLSWCQMQCGPACSKALVCSSVCQWHSQMSPQCLQVSCDQRLTVLLGFSITKPHSDSLFPFTNNCSNRFRMILLSKLLFPKWVFMFSPTWSPFPLCLCCFLKQIIGSPIIIIYLSLKKTFSLYWGIKVRADLLCIRKLAQGVLVTLQPSPWDTGAMKCTCFQVSFTQSANPQVFHIGSKTCLEPLRGCGSLASCLGTNTEGCRVAETPGPPTVLSSSATPSSTPPWMTATSTSAPWDLCASPLKACTSPQWQMTGNEEKPLYAASEPSAWKDLYHHLQGLTSGLLTCPILLQAPQDLGPGTEDSDCVCSYDQWSLLHIFSTWWSYCHRVCIC